ncbi:hypothetical protein AOQ84DRAFT_389153 [Glonium stellatum]|uniref:SET domain-containing protein n=1 Tax=Glonium stellatum TaxID=574774 RepID=A0A8E2F0F5_9PEZI|nr:hypothetical protein AOQ84DRAFT_389153 [Glonium stellatum]
MDIQDGSSSEALVQLLERQIQGLQAAKARKNQRPKLKPSKEALINNHYQSSLQTLMRADGRFESRQSFIPEAYPPATAPLCDLKEILLNQLRLEIYHVGRVLFAKLIVEPTRWTGITTLIEDSNGDVERLQIYNQSNDIDAGLILPCGRVVAIKDPYYKTSADGGYSVRVDHPSDILLLPPTSEFVPPSLGADIIDLQKTALQLKEEGNTAYKRKDYLEAIELFTQGLHMCGNTSDTIMGILKRNRALMYLITKQYDAAKSDATSSLVGEPDNVKSLYRAARACYELEEFEESERFLLTLLSYDKNDTDAQRELKRVKTRLQEATTGTYDFAVMAKSAETQLWLDHASFTERVAVQPAGSRGRGLFTTVPIKAGDLVFCEKAFSAAFGDEILDTTYILLNANTKRITLGTQALLIPRIVHKLQNPSLGPKFLDLYSSSYPRTGKEGNILDGTPVIDTFLVTRIVELNCFGCPRRSSDEAHQNKHITSKPAKGYKSSGIWPMASYINHSCLPNIHRSFIGDMMVVRATKDLAEDEELKFPYCDVTEGFDAIQKKTRVHWGFSCDCELCKLEEKSSRKSRKRRIALEEDLATIITDSESVANLPASKTAKVERFMREIATTYDLNIFKDMPRLSLAGATSTLAWIYAAQNDFEKTEEYSKATMQNLGFKLLPGPGANLDRSKAIASHNCVSICLNFSGIAASRGKLGEQRAFLKRAKEFYKICFGEDATFQKNFGDQLPSESLS